MFILNMRFHLPEHVLCIYDHNDFNCKVNINILLIFMIALGDYSWAGCYRHFNTCKNMSSN